MLYQIRAISRNICAAALTLTGLLGTAAQADQRSEPIRMGYALTAPAINPAFSGSTISHYVLDHLFLGLVDYSPEEGVVPMLAESWSNNDDASVYTFTLREDLFWSDGTPITAAEMADSFQYLATLEDSAFATTFPGAEVTAFEQDGRDMLRIDLATPSPLLISEFSHVNFAILPMHLRDEIDFSVDWPSSDVPKNLVYSGPYMLTSASDTEWDMERNPNYSLSPLENDRILFQWLSDNAREAVAAVLSGQTDIIGTRAPAQFAFVNDLEGIVMESLTNVVSIDYYLLNLAQPPFDDIEIRRAITYAMADELPSGLLGESYLDPNRGMLPSAMTSTFDAVRPYWLDEDPRQLIVQAREIMRAKGYSEQNRLSMKIHVNSSSTHERVAAAMARRLAEIFVDAEVVATPFSEHVDRVLDDNEFAIARWGWSYSVPHPIIVLETFHSDNYYNGGQFYHAEFDEIIEKMRATADLGETNALSRQAHQIIVDNYAAIPMHARRRGIIRRENIAFGSMGAQNLPRLTEIRRIAE